MNWVLIIVVVAVFGTLLVLQGKSLVPAEVARKLLAQGALVIDVRSAGEFNSGHLPAAINLPLDELTEALPRRVPNKSQVLLLHCLSGTRSGIARRRLQAMGYTQVFNLGSYGRARQIVSSASAPAPTP
jgi:phage shock protein E